MNCRAGPNKRFAMNMIRCLCVALFTSVTAAPALAAGLYQVEMIVFQRWSDSQGEVFGALDNEDVRHAAVGDVASRAAGRASWRLGGAAAKLTNNGNKVLFHQAWRQTASSRSADAWYSLSGPSLRGVVRLSRGRYLHVDTDLTVGGIRARDHRRMRSGELHYIDHPRIGILVRVDVYAPGSAGATDPQPAS